MNVAHVTGHRPQVLELPFDLNKRQWDWMRKQLEYALVDELRVDKLLTGMALGVDQLAAEVASRNGIPFVAVIPFEGQESRWPRIAQERYRELLDIADEQIVVSPGGYAAWKMLRRNEWMVDHSQQSIAVWNGDRKGGTYNCVQYALDKRDVWGINPRTENAGWVTKELLTA